MKTFSVKHILPVVILGLSFLVCGCGGGGGGGGGSVGPVVSSGSEPVQSGWSPAKNSIVATRTPTVTFQTNIIASCRWSLSDSAYSSMSAACSGTGTRSHTCSVSGFSEGSRYVYTACSDAAGVADSSSTNENIPYFIDTLAPTVSITYPEDGYSAGSTRPAYVSVSYSDSGSGVDIDELEVYFTLQGRKVDMTALFGKDATANASSSMTDSSVSDPLALTSISSHLTAQFTTAEKTWPVDRSGQTAIRLFKVDDNTLIAWDTAGKSAWLIDPSQDAIQREFTFSSVPLDIAASGASGELYVIFDGGSGVYRYSITTGASLGTWGLTANPAALSYNPVFDALYVSYKTQTKISLWDCASASASSTISLDHTPSMFAAWPDSTGDIISVAEAAGFRMYRISPAGSKRFNSYLGLQLPGEISPKTESNTILVTMFADDNVIAVDSLSGVKTEVSSGAAPTSLFSDSSGGVFAINSGDNNISSMSIGATSTTLVASSLITPPAPVSDGVFMPGSSNYIIADDVWYLTNQEQVSVTVTIKDKAGNTGTDSNSFTISPASPGRITSR